jgi:hypothetical protein
MDKVEEMGNHWHRYYQLETSFFKTPSDEALLERLWNDYWVDTLSSSPTLNNQTEITNSVVDANQKISKAHNLCAPAKMHKRGPR